MKIKQATLFMALGLMSVMAGTALAQGDQELSDQQYCEQEADAAGMVDAADIKEYVQQCLDEIQVQNAPDSELDMESGSETAGDDSSKW